MFVSAETARAARQRGSSIARQIGLDAAGDGAASSGAKPEFALRLDVVSASADPTGRVRAGSPRLGVMETSGLTHVHDPDLQARATFFAIMDAAILDHPAPQGSQAQGTQSRLASFARTALAETEHRQLRQSAAGHGQARRGRVTSVSRDPYGG